MKAIVTGMIATYPVGGVAWDYGQYALGLERMGFDVYYLEDTGWETYDPTVGAYGSDSSYGVKFLEEALSFLSPDLGSRWHFRAMDGRTYGIEPDEMAALVADADVFVNVSGGTLLRDEYLSSARKVFIDSDPGWNHFVNFPKWDASPGWQGSHGYRAHDHFFTYAENIGSLACALPTLDIEWKPTRPPVVLDMWTPEPPGETWTTVMTWNNFREPIEYDGVTYGTKELEFARIESLPQHVAAPLEVAVGGNAPPIERWQDLGWSVVSSEAVSRTSGEYRHYIQGSRGEFSVAKNVYAATRSGWFSCRSVCYLAAGLPVIAQDTGWSAQLPAGEGLLGFDDLEGAVRCVERVESDRAHHMAAARKVAESYFAAEVVLGDLLGAIGL